MEFLALLTKRAGIEVTGSDLKTGGHDAQNVAGADAVVYSYAIGRDNPEYAEAERLGLPLISRAQLLGGIAKSYNNVIAVCGTHGKTTTTAMLMSALKGLNPTVHVGGSVGGVLGNIGSKEIFITEACEYRESFLELSPDVAIVLNVELDHADYFKTYANFYDAFEKFTAQSRVAFVCGDNEAKTLKGVEKTFTFGLDKSNDYYAEIEGESSGYYRFWAYFRGQKFAYIKLGVRGVHNVTNAIAVLAYCHYAGFDFDGISDFTGVDRRFESLGIVNGIEYISDYAHHPHEIECSLIAAKKIYKRVLVVFEPHTFTRTQAFYKEFASALGIADRCILLPVYPAREAPIDGVGSEMIGALGGFKVASSYDEACKMIEEVEAGFDAVIFMGAGTVDDLARSYFFCKKSNQKKL